MFINNFTFSNIVSVNFVNLVFLLLRAGGPWLITDMDRIDSIFEIDPNLQVMLF